MAQGGIPLTAALVNSTDGLNISVCDQTAAGSPEPVGTGFRAHAVYPVEVGFVVMEIGDDAEDHRAFFESAVKPNMPDGVRFEIQVMERHSTIGALSACKTTVVQR